MRTIRPSLSIPRKVCVSIFWLMPPTRSLKRVKRSGVTVVELAPPSTETPLLRAEFAEEMKNEKDMDPVLMVQQCIGQIEAGQLEICPGLSKVLKVASRVAPGLIFKQMTKLSRLAPLRPST